MRRVVPTLACWHPSAKLEDGPFILLALLAEATRIQSAVLDKSCRSKQVWLHYSSSVRQVVPPK